ncbi:MAG: CBS domain-containing protein, partial [Deltaproteobacteria bacterium]|nr:CBS domain-containing protein [Deltaproteobacteria bacterium]
RHLPIVDSDRKLVGILSERDLRGRLGAEQREWAHAAREALEETVGNLMTPDPVLLRAGTPLTRAVEVFMAERIGAVPVVDDEDHVLGILSYVDLLRWLRDRAGGRPKTAGEEEPLHPQH